MNEYSENYEKEVSLVELLFYCLKNWRWIVVSMILMAVLAGGYKYQSVARSNRTEAEQQALMEEYGITEPVDSIKNPRVSYYEQAIESSEQELAKQEAYLRDSVVMQLDANHLHQGTLSFYLDGMDDENSRNNLLAAYETYVVDGKLAEELAKIDTDVPITDLQYLLSFDDGSEEKNTDILLDGSEKSVNLTIGNTVTKSEQSNVFKIKILAMNEETCSAYLEAIEKSIATYSMKLAQEVAMHQLKILESVQIEKADDNIRQHQLSTLFSYKVVLSNMKNLKTDLKTVRNEEDEVIVFGETDPAPFAVKFLLIGSVLGAFMAGLVLVLIYLMSGKLRSTEGFQEEYGLHLIGDIKAPIQKKKFLGFIDTWIYRLEQGAYANITREEQMRIAVASFKGAVERMIKKEGLKKIMLAGTIAEKDVAELCNCLKENAQEIEYSSYKQIVFDAEALEEVEDYDTVAFLEKKGLSYSKLIRKEKELVLSKNTEVLGVITL